MRRLTCIISLMATLIFGVAIDAYAQPRIKGNVYGGGENAKVMGENLVSGESSTNVLLNNGEVYGDIY